MDPRPPRMLPGYSGCIARASPACWRARRTDIPKKTSLLAQEFKLIGCRLCWFCMKGFPERSIIVLGAVHARRNFPHSHLVGGVGDEQLFQVLVLRFT